MNLTLLNDLGAIMIDSPKAEAFLQGQLTCDVKALANGDSTLAAHCNAKGRVVSLFTLFKRNDIYYLIMPLDVIDIALANLNKYAIFSKITPIIAPLKIYGILGKPEVELDDLIRIPDAHLERYYLIDFNAVDRAVARSAEADWHSLDIAAGIPRLYKNTIEEFLPHALNLPALGAVSFNKGCYTGQEIIARLEYRGQLKQHLKQIKILNANIDLIGKKIMRPDNTSASIGHIVDAIKDGDDLLTLSIWQDDVVFDEVMIDEKSYLIQIML
jgi:folate-binding protein YgfZ